MKNILSICFLLIAAIIFGQSVQKEIDNQIWIPFTIAWEANDGEAYNKIHSDEIWRINPGRLLVGDEYKSRNLERMKGQSEKRIIEFSFESRTAKVDKAYEVGYYRITDTSEATPKYYVSRFHVALKKTKGIWKIIHDWDTGEINGEQITSKSLETRDFIHFQ